MVTIDDTRPYCTLINVFTVEPEKQQALATALRQATEQVMSKLSGYVSASIHVGDDHQTVTNYAQWVSLEAYQNVMQNPEAKHHMQQAAAMALDFKPVTYAHIWSHEVDDKN